MKKIILALVVIVIVVGVGYVVIADQAKKSAIAKIASFEECANYFPVRETYPEQCVTPDGRTFVFEGDEIESPPEPYEPAASSSNTTDLRIRVTTPSPDTKIVSPLAVKGEARGTWYFEASFPVKLLDEKGNVIAQTPAQAQGDWMTENFVPFEATLTFTATSGKGTLVLERDNPSGLPQNDAQVRIPVSW